MKEKRRILIRAFMVKKGKKIYGTGVEPLAVVLLSTGRPVSLSTYSSQSKTVLGLILI